jgi:hypothetical protein
MGTSKYSARSNNVQNIHLYTKGKQFSLSGVEYVGEYHLREDGPWTEPIKSDTSEKLQKYYTNKDHYVYDRVKEFVTPPYQYVSPTPIIYRPTQQAYTTGQDIRYFVEKINDEKSYAIEIDQKQFDRLGKNGGIDSGIYLYTSILWKLVGTLEEVSTFNETQIQKAKRIVPTIDYAIPNLIQFAILK